MNQHNDAFECFLADENATVAMGKKLSQAINESAVIFLLGDLGAGKTTLTRGVMQGFGHTGNVKSPTYTLVELYDLTTHRVAHFDLYRINKPQDLEGFGLRDYLDGETICLFEWPEKGVGFLPQPKVRITLNHAGSNRIVQISSSVSSPDST